MIKNPWRMIDSHLCYSNTLAFRSCRRMRMEDITSWVQAGNLHTLKFTVAPEDVERSFREHLPLPLLAACSHSLTNLCLDSDLKDKCTFSSRWNLCLKKLTWFRWARISLYYWSRPIQQHHWSQVSGQSCWPSPLWTPHNLWILKFVWDSSLGTRLTRLSNSITASSVTNQLLANPAYIVFMSLQPPPLCLCHLGQIFKMYSSRSCSNEDHPYNPRDRYYHKLPIPVVK